MARIKSILADVTACITFQIGTMVPVTFHANAEVFVLKTVLSNEGLLTAELALDWNEGRVKALTTNDSLSTIQVITALLTLLRWAAIGIHICRYR